MTTTPTIWLDRTTPAYELSGPGGNDQYDPDIIGLANGNYLVTYTSNVEQNLDLTPRTEIRGIIYDPLGNDISGELVLVGGVNQVSAYGATAAATSDGGFKLIYRTELSNGVGLGHSIATYDSAGGFEGAEAVLVPFNAGGPSFLFDLTYATGRRELGTWDLALNSQDEEGIPVKVAYDYVLSTVWPFPSGSEYLITTETPEEDDFIAVLYDRTVIESELPQVLFDSTGARPDINNMGEAAVDYSDGDIFHMTYSITGVNASFQPVSRIHVVVSASGIDTRDSLAYGLNEDLNSYGDQPDIAVLNHLDRYAVVWRDTIGDGSGTAIRAKVFESDGTQVGGMIDVNTTTLGDQRKPQIVALNDGGFMVGWIDKQTDDVRLQRFDEDGAKVGTEVTFPNSQGSDFNDLSLDILPNGRVLVAAEVGNANQGIRYAIYNVDDCLITGTDAGETLIACPEDSVLEGLGGDDTLIGLDGDDILSGGTGVDTFDGGDGFDTVDYSYSGSNWTIDLSAGTATAGSTVESLTSIENVIGGSGDDTITGDSGVNYLTGGAGDDYFVGGGGRDTFDGGAGIDTVDYSGNEDNFDPGVSGTHIYDLQQDRYDHAGGVGLTYVEALTGIENVFGGSQAETFIGDAAINHFKGNGGNDTFVHGFQRLGFPGVSDLYEGGSATDSLDFALITPGASETSSDLTFTIDMVAGEAAQTGGFAFATFNGMENVRGTGFDDTITGDGGNNKLFGAGGNDIIIGGAGDDELNGNLGDDYLRGGSGTDNYNGGFGFDTVSWEFSSTSWAIDLTGGGASDGSVIEYITNVESFILTNHNDTFRGIAEDETIEGGLGADDIDGGGGSDTAAYTRASLSVIVDLNLLGVQQNTIGGGLDTLRSIENITGSAFNDFLFGDGGDNILKGGAGNDILMGRGGADQFLGGEGKDTVSYVQELSGVVVDMPSGTGSGAAAGDAYVGIEKVIGTGFDDTMTGNWQDNEFVGGDGVDVFYGKGGVDILYGDAGDDILDGGKYDDFLYGGDNNDTISGGLGNDTIFGNNGIDYINADEGEDYIDGGLDFDRVNFADSTAGVIVDIELGTGSGGYAQGDTYVGIERVTGSEFDDTIIGNSLGNSLRGRGGIDTIFGESGRDVIEGDDGDDVLHGGAQNDKIFGDADNDQLFGDGGFDFLYGGDGDDTMTGGADADYFVFETGTNGFGGDLILDFEDGLDKLDVRGVFSVGNPANVADDFSDFTVETSAAYGVKIRFEAGQVIYLDDTINGITVADIDASDFVFA